MISARVLIEKPFRINFALKELLWVWLISMVLTETWCIVNRTKLFPLVYRVAPLVMMVITILLVDHVISKSIGCGWMEKLLRPPHICYIDWSEVSVFYNHIDLSTGVLVNFHPSILNWQFPYFSLYYTNKKMEK